MHKRTPSPEIDPTSVYIGLDDEDAGIIPRQEAFRIDTVSTFSVVPYRPIRIHENVAGGCGGKTWEAADALCDYVYHRFTQDSAAWSGKRVLELGCGTGVVGIMCAMLANNNGRVALTDLEFLLDLIGENVRANLSEGEQKSVDIYELKWGEKLPEKAREYKQDVILAADCVYLESAFDPLLSTLLDLCPDETVELVIASKKRRKADKNFFIKLRKHFNLVELTYPRHDEFSKQGVTLYSATRKTR